MNTTRARASGNLLDASMIEPVIFIENGSFQNASSDDMLSLPVGSSIYADCVQNEMMQLDGVGDFEPVTDIEGVPDFEGVGDFEGVPEGVIDGTGAPASPELYWFPKTAEYASQSASRC